MKNLLKKIRKISIMLINFYQSYLSFLINAKCRYYPSCSEYSKQVFYFENPLIALYQTLLRILSCNQFFAGGIHYPIAKLPITQVPLYSNRSIKKSHQIAFWLIPIDSPIKPQKSNYKRKQKVYILKNLSKESCV